MPICRQTRVQMDMRPLVCACFSVGLNVFFMFNWREETPFGRVCQMVIETIKMHFLSLSDDGVVVN
jgi:hypothetical protein